MATSQHQGDRGLLHPCDHLRNGKPRLNVPPHGIEKQQQTIHVVALLDPRKQGQNVLILGGLHRLRGHLMALHLADDGQGVDVSLAGAGHVRAQLHNLLPLLFFHIRVFVRIHIPRLLFHRLPQFYGSIPYCESGAYAL